MSHPSTDELPMSDHERVQAVRALSDPVRWVLVRRIADAPEGVGTAELEDVASITKPTLSYHLRILRDAQLIDVKRRGRKNVHCINLAGFEAIAVAISDQLLGAPPAPPLDNLNLTA
jgi:DNA-binding transcriptional ArsR family regulator